MSLKDYVSVPLNFKRRPEVRMLALRLRRESAPEADELYGPVFGEEPIEVAADETLGKPDLMQDDDFAVPEAPVEEPIAVEADATLGKSHYRLA